MSEEDFAALKEQVEALKVALTKKEVEAQQTAANIELMELELKVLLRRKFRIFFSGFSCVNFLFRP